jgi:hypothetical protein
MLREPTPEPKTWQGQVDSSWRVGGDCDDIIDKIGEIEGNPQHLPGKVGQRLGQKIREAGDRALPQ